MTDPGERDALRYVEASPRDGGVLARYYLGMTFPAYTGRQTWLGQFTWSPEFPERQARVDALFAGDLAPAAARRMVARIGPAFLLTDCRTQVDLRPILGPMVLGVRRFGCARVYAVRARPL